jgi:hypothetical protein
MFVCMSIRYFSSFQIFNALIQYNGFCLVSISLLCSSMIYRSMILFHVFCRVCNYCLGSKSLLVHPLPTINLDYTGLTAVRIIRAHKYVFT